MPLIDQSQDADKRICWARGDEDGKTFTILQADGTAEDISAWTLTLSVDTLLDPPDATTLQFAITGTLPGGGTDGKVLFTPAVGDTDLTPGEYFYDLQRDSPDKKTLIKAGADIIQDITKT